MAYWIRSANMQIGPYRYNLDGMEFSFDCPFEDSDEPGTCEATITNLSEQTRHSIVRHHPLIINAGYEGDTGLIFKGAITSFSSRLEGTEWVTSMTAIEVEEDWTTKQVNKSYKEDSTAIAIVRDLCNIFGVEVARLELPDKNYPRGRPCVGLVKNVLREIVTGECKARMLIRHGRLYITDPNSPINMGFLLAPHTGLLACDEDFEDPYILENLTAQKTQTAKEDSTKLKSRTCLLNYQLGPGDVIMVQSKSLNGRFMVARGAHRGSRSGDWQTEIELKPV